jgi:hypothetical protein
VCDVEADTFFRASVFTLELVYMGGYDADPTLAPTNDAVELLPVGERSDHRCVRLLKEDSKLIGRTVRMENAQEVEPVFPSLTFAERLYAFIQFLDVLSHFVTHSSSLLLFYLFSKNTPDFLSSRRFLRLTLERFCRKE